MQDHLTTLFLEHFCHICYHIGGMDLREGGMFYVKSKKKRTKTKDEIIL